MRINLTGSFPEAVQDSRSKPMSGGAGAAGTTPTGTGVEFTSSNVREIATQLAQTPDIRWDKVAPLKLAIQQGKYSVSNQQVASAMIGDWFGGR